MANISDAYGSYIFDFTKTGIATDAKAKKAFISTLHNLTCQCSDGFQHQYFTDFHLDMLHEEEYNQGVINVPFEGCGRWWYTANVHWYTTDETLRDHLLTCEGLVMTASYLDAEFSVKEIYEAKVVIGVQYGGVKITDIDITTHELTAESSVSFGFYDSVDDFLANNEDFSN